MRKSKKRVKKYTSYLEPRSKHYKDKKLYALGYVLIIVVVVLAVYLLSKTYLYFQENILT